MLLSDKRALSFEAYSWLSDPILGLWIVEHLKPYGMSICEVGAGTGNLLTAIASYFSRICLVEPSPLMLLRLREKIRELKLPIEIKEGAAENIPLSSKSTDIVIAKSSLHHFDRPVAAIAEMARVATSAVAVVEVVLPDPCCAEYIRDLVLSKEPERSVSTIFSEQVLTQLIAPVCREYRAIHFDQYIDLTTWLKNGDSGTEVQSRLLSLARAQRGKVKEKMQIHIRDGRLVQLRRMCLVIGVL